MLLSFSEFALERAARRRSRFWLAVSGAALRLDLWLSGLPNPKHRDGAGKTGE